MYPEDFDGVIAGASANYWEALNVQVRALKSAEVRKIVDLEKLTASSSTFLPALALARPDFFHPFSSLGFHPF
jgi:hypothetical protein